MKGNIMKNFLLYTFLSLLFASISFSQIRNVKHHAFSGTVMIGAEAGMTLGFTDYANTKPQIVGRGILEYFFPTTSSGIFGLKAFMSAGYVGGKDSKKNPTVFRSTITRIGRGIFHTHSQSNSRFFLTYF